MSEKNNGAHIPNPNATKRNPFYLQQQVDEVREEKAQRKILGLLNGWKDSMADRDKFVMARHDGSELRGDELRFPPLSKERRSSHTQDHPPQNVTAPDQANHAIMMFHNLMFALDKMMVNDSRDLLRLHLTAEFVLIRALIEAATTALWILGPDDSDTRVTRALRLCYDELDHSFRLGRNFAKFSETLQGDDFKEQTEFVDGAKTDLITLATDAKLNLTSITKGLSPTIISSEAGAYVPNLGKALTFWYWSTASSLAHGEPANMKSLSDMKFIGVDHRNTPVGHYEPSAASILLHLEVAIQIIERAHQLWNSRARAGRGAQFAL